jgi:hypothetical protein
LQANDRALRPPSGKLRLRRQRHCYPRDPALHPMEKSR